MERHSVGTGPHVTSAAVGRRRDLDVTVIALPQHLPLLRQTARSFAAGHGVPRPEDVRLAVSEACLNCVQYAYPEGDPGPLRLHAFAENGHVVFTVEDHGLGLRADPMHESLGLGLPIVARVTDDYSVENFNGGGTRVRMVFATGFGAAR